MALKAVIFCPEGVLWRDTSRAEKAGFSGPDGERFRDEAKHLFSFLRSKGVRCIIFMNHERTYRDGKISIDEALTQFFGEHQLYVAARGEVPWKPQRAATEAILQKQGLNPQEVIVIGSSQDDFKTAVNGSLLFLNAVWDRQEAEYGFPMGSPSDVERFIDLFALRDHHWFYKIDTPVQFRSLGPFSTLKTDFAYFSEVARSAAKTGTSARHFFLNSLVAALYFSGELTDIHYVACVPGHSAGYGNKHMDDVLKTVGEIARARYLPDLIVRHTEAPSRRQEKVAGRTPDPLVQFNTMHLTRRPLKNDDGERYKTPIKLKGKTVLIFDDFMTDGVSLEAARTFLTKAGASVRMVSWLKTINRGYTVATVKKDFDPYKPHTFSASDVVLKALDYQQFIVDRGAPVELEDALRRFEKFRSSKK